MAFPWSRLLLGFVVCLSGEWFQILFRWFWLWVMFHCLVSLPLEVRFRSYWLCEVVVDSVSIVTDGTRVSLLVWSAQLSSGFGELGLPIRSSWLHFQDEVANIGSLIKLDSIDFVSSKVIDVVTHHCQGRRLFSPSETDLHASSESDFAALCCWLRWSGSLLEVWFRSCCVRWWWWIQSQVLVPASSYGLLCSALRRGCQYCHWRHHYRQGRRLSPSETDLHGMVLLTDFFFC